MKPEPKHDPSSVSTHVRERIEKKASGCAAPRDVPVARHTNNHPQTMKDEFLDLLFSGSSPNATVGTGNGTENKTCLAHEKLKTKGTKELFFPLNRGEAKERNVDGSKNPFAFSINNSTLGELNIQGTYLNGNLQLHVEMPPKMGIQEQQVLAKILEAKLSKELGVKLEVKIGRST